MAFARTQLRQLKRRLDPKWIKHRESNGQTLNYIEGWHAVSEANRVFGFDGWDRETIASQCVWAKPIGARYGAAYLTRVRITVRAGDQRVVREGSGTGEATAASPGLAHEIAAKGAETDATKRALSTFGNLFGLSLYGGNSDPNTPASPQRFSNGQFGRAAAATGATHSPTPEAIEPPRNSVSELDESSNADGMASAEEPSTPPWPDIDPFEEAAARAAQSARIDKSRLFRSEVQRLRDPGHLRYVAGLACLVCGRKPSHAHHLRFGEVHTRGNEEAWWQENKLSPLAVARELWTTSRRHRDPTALQADFLRGNLPDLNADGSMDSEADIGSSTANDHGEAS
jgi:hypothetical protein